MSEPRDLTIGELAALVAPICGDDTFISICMFRDGEVRISIRTKFGMSLEDRGTTIREALGKIWQTHTSIAAAVFAECDPPAPLLPKRPWWKALA